MNFQKSITSINVDKVESAIADFESSVDFEFIPVIAKKSSYVEHIAWIISLITMILLVGLVEYIYAEWFFDSWISKWPFLLATPMISFLVGYVLDKSDIIDRFFITKRERARQVQERAELLFYRKRLHEIKSQNALMLYISIMERQIVLFHGHKLEIPGLPEIERKMLRLLQESFKKYEYESGLISCIELLKTSLAPNFLKNGQSDENLVPNKLIWIDD